MSSYIVSESVKIWEGKYELLGACWHKVCCSRKDVSFIKQWFDKVVERNKWRLISAKGYADAEIGDPVSFNYSEPRELKIKHAKWEIQKFFRNIYYSFVEFYYDNFKKDKE